MRLKTRTWFIISVLCFLGAAYFWRLGDDHSSRNGPSGAGDARQSGPHPGAEPRATNAASLTNAPQSAAAISNRYPYRLSNTSKTLEQLMQSETALMLQNALFDTSEPLKVAIPAHLRAEGETGTYVVQAKGTITDAFRAQLKNAGAEIVAYVPHNAYLVQVGPIGAKALEKLSQVQAVLAWEPYYKLEPALLEKAVKQEPMPAGSLVNLLVFPGQGANARAELTGLGLRVVGEERSPFGPQLVVQMPQDQLVSIAKMSSVQVVETFHRRAKANDLGRTRLNVATDGVTASNYRDLTGQGVIVNLNDTGVNTAHPDLPAGRINGLGAGIDSDGHGTHVAGTIAGSGVASPISPAPPGSTNGASFRGMAPLANLYVLPIDVVTGPINADTYLQETAALNNADVSNNSWGYPGAFGYNSAAASWDAAVRDSLPGKTGEQPMLYVFAAGNSGSGNSEGSGGSLDSLNSPATAKNVISVGAIESFREITNTVVINGETNTPLLALTDSSDQVAYFSSRGNVGFGIEGVNGRFKPDVVAPGSFVISANSGNGGKTNYYVTFVANQTLRAGQTNLDLIFVPDNSVEMTIRIVTNNFSPSPMPPIPIFAKQANPPTAADFLGTDQVTLPVVPDLYYYSLGNSNSFDVRFDLLVIIAATNTDVIYDQALAELNNSVAPWYRYESGTSMAAPMVSGTLALMQEFFHARGETNSPALMKALLINGARSMLRYDLNVGSVINHQGWGLVNLTNSLPLNIAAQGTGSGSLVYFDQDATNALATGKSQTRTVTLSGDATNSALRFTLVWTDPPGNPAVGVKLVNDLDLIVTNLTTQEVFIGNTIGGGATFTSPSDTNSTNGILFDLVNNVENVFIGKPGTQYSVTVRAHRVNVNAVDSHPDGVVQDYALVISSDGDAAGALNVSPTAPQLDNDPTPFVILFTNGIPTMNFKVGANSPLLLSTNGVTNQWTFFVFNNAPTNTYLGFVTFLSQNLSRPRLSEADIDMFVSLDPQITNLAPTALFGPNTWRSLGRGGSEFVILTNATAGPYYVGIKSEDQQASTFGFAAIASDKPFSNKDTNGNVYVRGYPIDIPDGTDLNPGGQMIIALNPEQITIESVVVTNTLTHELGGDLFGQLSHNGTNAVLNNHYSFVGTKMFIWDDSDSGEILTSQRSDGLPTLRAFTGDEGLGVWTLTEIDNSLFATGRVDNLFIKIKPRDTNLLNGVGITRTILPNRWFYTAVDVPVDATNLQVCVAPQGLPVEVYIRRGDYPDRNNFDASGNFSPPGGCLNLGLNDSPPLTPGRYYIGVYNPNSQPVTVTIRANIERDLRGGLTFKYRSGGTNTIFDDAVTNSTIFIPRRQFVYDVKVGIRADHERASDLVFHLVSPSGNRVLLSENRDWLLGSNYGSGYVQKLNLSTVNPTGGPNPNTNIVGAGINVGSVQIEYDFQTYPDQMQIFYDGRVIYDTGLISDAGTFTVDFGPGLSTNVVIVMNPRNNSNLDTKWSYTPTVFAGQILYATFTEDTNLAPLPIKYGTAPFVDSGNRAFLPTGQPVLSDGFEQAIPTNYNTVGAFVSGWRVDTAPVTVVAPGLGLTNPPYSGLNALNLQQGVVSTNVNLVASNLYVLTFAYTPKPSLTSSVPLAVTANATVTLGGITNLDLSATLTHTFTNLTWLTTSMVFSATSTQTLVQFAGAGQAPTPTQVAGLKILDSAINSANGHKYYLLDTTNWTASEAAAVALGGHLVTIDDAAENAWVFSLWGNGKCLWTGLNDAGTEGTFVWSSGTPVGYTNWRTGEPSSGPGTDEDYVYIHPATFGGASQWNDYENLGTVLGEPPMFGVVEVVLGQSSEMFVDAVKIVPVTIASNYWLPEEPLKPFVGEPAYGDWNLEIWDNRTGGGLTNNMLSWQLEMTFVNTNPPVIALTNHQCYTGTVAGAGMTIFAVNAPYLATFATNRLFALSGGPLDLIFNRGGVPTGDPGTGDYFLLSNSVAAVAYGLVSTNYAGQWDPAGGQLVTSNGLAAFQPGVRYYLAVQNTNPDQTNTFALCIDFDAFDTNLLRVVSLTNGICFTNTIGAGNVLDYYLLNASALAITNIFQTIGTNGNLGLVVSHGLPLPNLNTFQAISTNGTANELITLDTNQAVLPGLWYIGVANLGTNPVTYCMMATEISGYSATHLTNGVDVTNVVGFGFAPLVAASSVDYYVFTVPTNAYSVDVQTFNANGNVDLYVRTCEPSPPPGPTNYFYRSINAGTTNELVTISRDSVPTPSPGTIGTNLIPGDWCIAVVNVQGTPVTYTIRVTFQTNLNIIPLVNAGSFTNVLGTNSGFEVNYYSFDVTDKAIQAIFEVFQMAGNVDLYVNEAVFGLPGPTNVNSVASANLGTANELLRFLTNGVPGLVKPTTYYLGVWNKETTNVSYVVRATELDPPRIIELNNAIPYSNTVPPPNGTTNLGVDYYLFRVASNAIQATFETYGANGDVDLFIKKDLPLPGVTNYQDLSTNSGFVNEYIRVLPNGATPAVLSSGDWYLAVVTKAPSTSVSYKVKATQVLANSILRLTNCVTFSTSLPGTNAIPSGGVQYYIYTVGANAVQANFEVFTNGFAPGDADLFVTKGLPLPGPTNFLAVSQRIGTNNEFAQINKSSTPPLSGGDYYIAVVNKSANPLTYGVRVTEVAEGLPTLTRLFNRVPQTNTVVTNRLFYEGKIDYFVFTVSSNAQWATFEIGRPTNTVVMLISKDLPLPTRTLASYKTGVGTGGTNNPILIATNSTPVPLSPGDWYIGVTQSTFPVAGTGTFDYSVTAVEYTSLPPVKLSDCSPVAGNLAPGATAYYQFDVTNSAVQANFQVLPTPTGNVDLYLKRGLPAPDASLFSYASTLPGTGLDMIRVTNNAPIDPLTAGPWYLAVVNNDTTTVGYVVSAGQYGPGKGIHGLSNGSADVSKEPLWNGNDCNLAYYQYTFSSNAQWATFDLSGDAAVMFARQGLALPDPYSFEVSLTNAVVSNRVSMTLTTSSTPVALKPGATWYFAISDVGQTPNSDFRFQVTEFTSRPPVDLTNCAAYASTAVGNTVDYYKFTVASNAVQANFEILNPSANVDLFIIPKGLGLPGPQNYYYFSTNAGTANELIALTINRPTNALTPGEWEIAVVNQGGNTQYRLMVSQFIPDQNIVRLSNGVAYRNTAGAAGLTNNCLVDYYVYTVTSNATMATFEVFNMTADVNLYLRKGVPLPDSAKFHYASANTGTNDELITVLKNSGPVLLAPGDWYLGVEHTNTAPVVYSVKATESNVAPTNLMFVSATIANGNFCMLWTNTLPGTNYYLQAKASLSLSNWSVAPAALVAGGTSITTCVPIPTGYQFFRLAEGPAPAAPFSPISPQKTLTAGKTVGNVLEWTAPVESRFVIEWSSNGAEWTLFPDVITSTNGVFQYIDDSGTGRIYRIIPGL
jgi:subtilisin-like proprotein convertase family protein